MRLRKIGVFGGAFDPVHLGHLRTAIEVAQRFDLSHVRLIPSGNPPHRPPAHVEDQHRLAMLQRAVEPVANLVVDEREILRSQRSYTIDTLESVQADYPAARLVLIIGMDQFCVFDTWHRWQQILQMAELIVMERPGEALNDVGRGMLARPDSMSIQLCAVTQLAISSSRIRHDLQQQMEIYCLVPYAVQTYIHKHNLYGARSDPHG